MANAGYKAAVYLAGTPAAVTGAACTSLTSTVYQITNDARRVIDPDAAIVVKANGVTVAASGYTINYLFGKITFAVAPTAPVTIDYSYVPLSEACSIRGFSLSFERTELDVTTFCTVNSDGNVRRKKMGLVDRNLTLDSVDDSADTSRGNRHAELIQTDDVPVVVSIKPDRSSAREWRLRGFISMMEDTGEVEGLVTSSINFTASDYKLAGNYSRNDY